jgi:hypothetical protein
MSRKRGTMHRSQSLINHVALVLDGSSSMAGHTSKVIEVADAQIKHLAIRSEELHQETRVSVYLFADTVQCLIFDMDVMRLPSIEHLYTARGNTALIDATMKSQEDLATTSQIYGDHGFLTFVITDGQENMSRLFNRSDMIRYITGMKPGWSLGFLVPAGDERGYNDGKAIMRRMDVPADMIQTWDTADLDGFVGAGQSVTAASDSFMTSRAAGRTVLRSAFSTGTDAVNATTVKAALTPLPMDKYTLIPVEVGKEKVRADEFIRDHCGMKFVLGTVYYQWNKRESVQPQKRLAVVEKKTGKVFVGTGDEIRSLIGLPSMLYRDKPVSNPDYDVFVQSTAPNRNLIEHTKALVMK